jgi:uncharacterized protein
MKLHVLPLGADANSWYSSGLRFTCSQCGNCCTGGPGYVWISDVEIERMAEYLAISRQDLIDRYCRRVNGRLSLKEHRRGGNYDCIFLKEVPITPGEPASAGAINTRRICEVYPVRPLQCRTWPFWPENLASQKDWSHAAKRCHGMNRGRAFTIEEIRALRDAADWPDRPPTSE